MITVNPQKYIVRDDVYESECQKVIEKIGQLIKSDSFFAYLQCSDPAEKISIILQKNNEDYTRHYKENFVKFSILMENLSWELIEPLTVFESKVKKLTSEIKPLLENRDYNTNKKSKDKIAILENLVIEYGEDTKMPDFLIRCRFHNKLNEIKRIIKPDSLISYLSSARSVDDLFNIYGENISLYKKHFIPVSNQLEVIKSSFESSKTFFSLKDAKLINDQIGRAEKLIAGDSYDDFIVASGILSEIESRFTGLASVKKAKIEENINYQLEAIKKYIWKEDWETIKKAVGILMHDAENSGQLYQLNLDRFNIEHKKKEKKEDIYKFIQIAETSKRVNDNKSVIEKARNLMSVESSRNDLAELYKITTSIVKKEKQISTDKKTLLRSIKYISFFVFILTASIVLVINNNKNSVHYEKKGQLYADLIETMVYAQIKSSKKINTDLIKKKITSFGSELRIISLDNNEVVINYRNKIYKKTVRSQ